MDQQEEPSFACTLIKALCLLKPKVAKCVKEKWVAVVFAKHGIQESPQQMTFDHFLQCYPEAVADVQKKLTVKFIVVKTFKKNKNRRHRLLYDGRHGIVEHLSNPALVCLWLAHDNRVYQCANTLDKFPRLSDSNYQRQQIQSNQPLWKILGYHSVEDHQDLLTWPEPTNISELKSYIQHFRIPTTKVKVKFATGLGRKNYTCDWFQEPLKIDSTVNRVITVLAFTNRRYGLSFATELESGLEQARRRGEKTQQQWNQYQILWEKWKQEEKMQGQADAYQANCAAGVTVSHGGLQLAHQLGLLSAQELKDLSHQLSLTYSTAYVFLDEKHHLRHITYYDVGNTFNEEVVCFENDNIDLNHSMKRKQQELDNKRRHQAEATMMSFWQKVWNRRSHWIEQRKRILQPLIQHLDQLLQGLSNSKQSKPMTSPFQRCLRELKEIIVRHRLYLYSKEDSHLHSIKYYLAHFAYHQIKKCRGLYIKAQSDDTLIKISLPGLTVMNIHIYLSCKTDLDFFSSLAEPWLGPHPSQVIISHSNKLLCNQRVDLDAHQNINVKAYCKQYGWLFARHIFRYWVNFSQFLFDLFGYDLQGQTSLPSASFLAFQCIWTRYAKEAGPMAQSLERCKPYYEDLLRECSRGGFMFSSESSVKQGEPLQPHVDAMTNLASSIAEYDLISAYGFGASQAHIPSGFCIGYQLLTHGQWLERLDPKLRYKSFEFRAVYKVIDKLTRRQGIALRSVYHNYSPLGVFTLGKYNLDLVVVQEDGRILMINMDGRWIHGCDVCPPTGTFAYGQSHQLIRAKSRQRDTDIQSWVDTINKNARERGGHVPLVEYIVIQDCHSPGYTTLDLDKSFASEPTLKQLVKGYQVHQQLGNEFTIDQFQQWISEKERDSSFTFILKGNVSIGTNVDHQQDPDGSFTVGPLVTYSTHHPNHFTDDLNDPNYRTLDGRSKRNCTYQRLAWEGSVVLTRNYYSWLQKTFSHQFMMDQIDWILFYKTEPIINDIYRQLVQMRSTTSDPILVTFIKKMVNLSAGFYGHRSTPLINKTTYRLVKKIPENYAFFRHTLIHQHSMDLADSNYSVLETKPWPQFNAKRQSSKSALAIFVTIVEYGKQRLVEMMHFLRQHLAVGSFRLMYSNIDNVILVLANGANSLEEAVESKCRDSFERDKSLFFLETLPGNFVKPPGLAECKWLRHENGWKFTTLRTQHYCLAAQDPQQSLFKVSGWSDVTTPQVLEWTEQLIQGQRVAIPQTRRVHKTISLETKPIVLNY